MTLRVSTEGGAYIIDDSFTPPRVVGIKQPDGTEQFFNLLASQPSAPGPAPVQPQGRLTLTTAVPVTTADVTGATTLYYTPHVGNQIPIYDGVAFAPRTFAELSNATAQSSTGKAGPAAVAASKVYDLFVWDDNGTLRLTRSAVWTDDTTRADALVRVNGIYLNAVAITNGPAAQRGTYVGTVYSDASLQLNDSLAKRHVWNAYNRARRAMQVFEATDTWAYTTATVRQANGAAGNQLDYVCGLAEDAVRAEIRCSVYNDNAGGVIFMIGVGVDSTTAVSGVHPLIQNIAASRHQSVSASYEGVPGLGRHYLAWLEYSGAGTGTTTWVSDNGNATLYQGGIVGHVFA